MASFSFASKSLVNWIKRLNKESKLIDKRHKRMPIIPRDQEKMKFHVKALEIYSSIPENKIDRVIKDFLETYDIVLLDDGIYVVVPRELIENTAIREIKECKEEGSPKQLNILLNSDAELYREYKNEPKILPNRISESDVNNFTPKLQSLLGLSAHADYLRKNNRVEDSNDIKFSISDTFGEPGIRFCNCYSRNYITLYLEYLNDNGETQIESKLWQLSKSPIFFINRNTHNTKEIAKQIVQAANQTEPYIALHSLGAANNIAKTIISYIPKDSALDNYTNKEIDKIQNKDFSHIWYSEDGEAFYELVKGAWN